MSFIDIRIMKVEIKENIEERIFMMFNKFAELYFVSRTMDKYSSPDKKIESILKAETKTSEIYPFITKGEMITFGDKGFSILKSPINLKKHDKVVDLIFMESDEELRFVTSKIKKALSDLSEEL
ncbi:MAG: hypothetical protein ACXAC7_24500, partial [Candidatus Hodarchaeales archaeon]